MAGIFPLFESTKQSYSLLLPPRLVGGNDRLWDGDVVGIMDSVGKGRITHSSHTVSGGQQM